MVRAAKIEGGIVVNVVLLPARDELAPDLVVVPDGVEVSPGDSWDGKTFTPAPRTAEVDRNRRKGEDVAEADALKALESAWAALNTAGLNALFRRLVRYILRLDRRLRDIEEAHGTFRTGSPPPNA